MVDSQNTKNADDNEVVKERRTLTTNIDVQIEDLVALRAGFMEFLKVNYNHFSHKGIICSDAFYIFKYNLGEEPADILTGKDKIEIYRDKLELHFKVKGRKNPKSDSYTYSRAIKLLSEYVNKENTIIRNKEKSEKLPIKQSRKGIKRNDIPRPCNEEVTKYLELWETLENYRLQEDALDKLFFKTYPFNTLIEDVLIKVSTLNDFYSTNIFSPYNVAKNIVALDIDNRLKINDETLVNDISKVKMENGNVINFYSFASKYCSHHKPLDYPIYDSYVDIVLRYFRDIDNFYSFKSDELKDYKSFKKILIKFQEYYGLSIFSLKEIDKYIWQMGKEKFPKNYGKSKGI